jgi:hypothetical protein
VHSIETIEVRDLTKLLGHIKANGLTK